MSALDIAAFVLVVLVLSAWIGVSALALFAKGGHALSDLWKDQP